MTKEYERVRDAIAMVLAGDTSLDFRDANFLEDADQILAIDGIRIEATDQSLPINIYNDNQYGIAQQDMLTPDSEGKRFVKCLPKEG